MTPRDLDEELRIELGNLSAVVEAVSALLDRLGDRDPNQDEKAALVSYTTSFYSGVENAFQIDWDLMRDGVRALPRTFQDFRTSIASFLDSLPRTPDPGPETPRNL
jgi:hypothetical protein